MKRSLLTTIILVVAIGVQAQVPTFWQKVNRFLTKPAVVDTTRIYQPRPCFSLGLFTTGQKAGFDVDVDFGILMGDDSSLPGNSYYYLGENLCKKIGLEVGYGNVGFGYGLEVGPRSASKKSSFAFNIVGKSWGVHLNYFKITNQFISGVSFGAEDDEDYIHDEFVSEEMAVLRNFSMDGYYVFNNKRFAYPAAYKMGLVQRRTAGSWMLTARYMQGDLYNSPEAAMDSYNMLDCFATMQASVGGGYSVNFVPWHRDPIGSRDEGLRNITINLTAMPVLTLFNYLKTTSYEYDDDLNLIENETKVMCYPVPNYIGSAAVSLTIGRVYFSTQFTYNRFFFRSRDAFNNSQFEIPEYLTDLDYRGIFHDWMLKGLLVYRF